MTEPKAEYTVTGTAGTRGKCPVCGTTMYRMGATPEHADIPKPDLSALPKREPKPRKNAKKCTTHGLTPALIIGGAITMATRM